MRQKEVFNERVTILLVALGPREFWIPRKFIGDVISCLTIISSKRDHRIIFKDKESDIFVGRPVREFDNIVVSDLWSDNDDRVGILNNSENDSIVTIITNCGIEEPDTKDISYLKLPDIEVQTIIPSLKLV